MVTKLYMSEIPKQETWCPWFICSRDPTFLETVEFVLLVVLKIFTPVIQAFWHTVQNCTFTQSYLHFVWNWGEILRLSLVFYLPPQYSHSTSNKKRTGLNEGTMYWSMSKCLYHWCQYFEYTVWPKSLNLKTLVAAVFNIFSHV